VAQVAVVANKITAQVAVVAVAVLVVIVISLLNL